MEDQPRTQHTDERDYAWARTSPTFVVVFHEDGHTGADHDTWELTGCGVLDAVRWARDKVASGGTWTLGVVEVEPDPTTGEPRKGVTYLEGHDREVSRPRW